MSTDRKSQDDVGPVSQYGRYADRVDEARRARVCQDVEKTAMTTFERRHAQIDPDPLIELERRLALWASAPDSRGCSLNAQIVPQDTIRAAIKEIKEHRAIRARGQTT